MKLPNRKLTFKFECEGKQGADIKKAKFGTHTKFSCGISEIA